MALLSTPMFCLTIIVAASNVETGPFEGDFETYKALFIGRSPETVSAGYPLDWENEILDK